METNIAKKSYIDNLTDTFTKTGITIDTSKTKQARAALAKDGAVCGQLSNVATVAAYNVAVSLRKSDAAIKDAAKVLGVLKLAESWKNEVDDSGKPYKSENAFFRAILPGYALSTVSIYADVGASIYVPAALGKMDDLPGIGDMSPGNAKVLLSAVKDADKRKALPEAIKTAKEANGGKITQRTLQAAVNSLKPSNAKPENVSDSAGQIANELAGGGIDKTVKSLIQFDRTADDGTGDLSAIVLEKNVKDFLSLLLKAKGDKDVAAAVCDTLYRLAKSAK